MRTPLLTRPLKNYFYCHFGVSEQFSDFSENALSNKLQSLNSRGHLYCLGFFVCCLARLQPIVPSKAKPKIVSGGNVLVKQGFVLRGQAAILLISRDACSDSIAKLFRACFFFWGGGGYRTTIARHVAKWGIAQMCLCETEYQGGVPSHVGDLLTCLKKYRAIWVIAPTISQCRYGATKDSCEAAKLRVPPRLTTWCARRSGRNVRRSPRCSCAPCSVRRCGSACRLRWQTPTLSKCL